ncbi:sphingomyelin phosphodiesterase [bacterium endosymbiont of Bathymodiolus sp. 5 South]|jgi:endonuclease/exonuclease/phosphatase family metal-dependent hydrolase|uniref:sphingomyelin phosphodiesterase n=2 Tax=bacterium endosymbiont of Bathymodiolus sp. 5 South TaxID=1181670 RepID=UPI0010B95B1E|nr:sphingomyelin phosphodiesterase [bacterium endosymbiont of Bathymodiolus sp. 5 South]CAC9640490.1 hypothetical protein [uncultured Gammaproteobacteria bacterium]CAC9660024.1 hypothetical protein [uncultured Gammaproteobacteria bacterium]SHN90574.1 hypothetical protein BCLUESOX_699 [bacterium endosymbiont of Bathymodiolus sp. 5 South]VVH59606.1 hypothetical protein BSPCLSOX_1431 [uncultured Gammaproteobacteria bacterium]VVH62831.1 hypothetical protein BSPWISOX_1207 [uncultured Gammaproteobac
MKRKIKNTILCLLLSALPLHEALAEYYIHFMNNTPNDINIKNTCVDLDSSACSAMNNGKLRAFKRNPILQVNYDQGIKYGRDYTVKSYFTSPNGTQGNYFSIIVHGDAIGSHIESIDVFIDGTTHNLLSNESDDEKVLSNGPGSYRVAHCDTNGSHAKPADVFIDGMTYNLLNNKNDNEKVLPNGSGSYSIAHCDTNGSHAKPADVFIDGMTYNLLNNKNDDKKVLLSGLGSYSFVEGGEKYTLYAAVQKDHIESLQGIDSIYLSIDKKPQVFTSNGPKEISLITYNIQAFPPYVAVALDLNKPKARLDYLASQKNFRNADVIVFEEAWDRDLRGELKANFFKTYPYSIDPVPQNTHDKPLNSGLLVLSKHPVTKQHFLNYQDHQSLVDADALSNKGALYFKINKEGFYYNFIATHTQAQDDAQAIAIRRQEFDLIGKLIVNSHQLNIPRNEPLMLIGDLNTDYYNQDQFPYLEKALNLNTSNMKNSIYALPKYSNDSDLNLMIPPGEHDQGMYDYIIPIKGFVQPSQIKRQITPIRALDDSAMYQRSLDGKLYHYGDVETSDHFMVQGLFKY